MSEADNELTIALKRLLEMTVEMIDVLNLLVEGPFAHSSAAPIAETLDAARLALDRYAERQDAMRDPFAELPRLDIETAARTIALLLELQMGEAMPRELTRGEQHRIYRTLPRELTRGERQRIYRTVRQTLDEFDHVRTGIIGELRRQLLEMANLSVGEPKFIRSRDTL